MTGRERLWAAQEAVEQADRRDRPWLVLHFGIAGWDGLWFREWLL